MHHKTDFELTTDLQKRYNLTFLSGKLNPKNGLNRKYEIDQPLDISTFFSDGHMDTIKYFFRAELIINMCRECVIYRLAYSTTRSVWCKSGLS